MKNLISIKIISGIIILAYLLVPCVFMENSTNMMNHAHRVVGMPDCPYMNGSQALCPFELSYYLNTWKSIFTYSLSNLKLFLLLFALSVAMAITLRLVLYDWLILYSKKRRTRIRAPYQELFSNGLLNPKVF